MENSYQRGSEWRKWDLHIHTPDTKKNDQFAGGNSEEKWRIYIEDINNSKEHISVVGVTDYFSIENYFKFKAFIENGTIKKTFDLILPNIELRINPVTSQAKPINIHCIFNPSIEKQIESRFLSKLNFSYSNSNYSATNKELIRLGKEYSGDDELCDETAYKEGINHYVISFDSLKDVFDKDIELRNNTIIAISNKSSDGVTGIVKHSDFFIKSSGSQLDAIRRSIYQFSDVIFSSNENDRLYFLGKRSDDKDIVIKKCGSLKPCIHGCDAHSNDKIFKFTDNFYCWIKADPTFEGLKQIIYEPEDRVFIGTRPRVLERVESDKTNYLESMKITHAEDYDEEKGIWFKGINIELNKELVVIIGKKGSGKSAIADILGMLGDTHVNANSETKDNSFSFLNKDKFLKQNLAENFKAKIIWESGGCSEYKDLSHKVDFNQKESVRYLPQNYFEKLTNEIEINSFKDVLENIIFEYIPEHERYNKTNFKELLEYKGRSIQENISISIKNIEELNKEIIALERKNHPGYKARIISKLEAKERELKTQEQLVKDTPKIINPNDDKSERKNKSEKFIEIEKLNKKIIEIDNEVEVKSNERKTVNAELEELSQIKSYLTRIEGEITEYKKDNREKFKSYGLKIDDIVHIEINKSSIDKIISDKKKTINNLNDILMSVTDIEKHEEDKAKKKETSLFWRKDELLIKINEIKQELTEKEKKYQHYREKLKKIQEKQKEIKGDKTTPDTLEFHKAEKEFINNELGKLLIDKREERLSKSLEIYDKKTEVIKLFRSFKGEVDIQVEKNKEILKDYAVSIESSFNLDKKFYKTFLRFIQQNKRGSFYGKDDGESKLKEIFDEKDFNDTESIKEILQKIIVYLEKDKRDGFGEAEKHINEQVEDLEDFYKFVFSLGYLKPSYELKLGDKKLDELSPGEKGALLLIFYLMIDKESIPLIIDQPEDNLDNESIFKMLTKFIKLAKKNRQIIIVTHNPNLAVCADAEQIIHVNIEKENKNTFNFKSGAIEAPEINRAIVDILEGTMPAFDKRKLKYLPLNY